ncbi:MAG: hypothetical protein JSR30_00175 [Proteobacteria bacterium]|nr:hypothetical protein [Pseudomonadota bacterium]
MNPDKRIQMKTGLQWLTIDPEFDTQDWHEPLLFTPPYDRRVDYRISIAIPRLLEFKVITWDGFARHHGLEVREYFDTFKSVRNWRIFIGSIPANWIIETHRNPTRYEVAKEFLDGEN